MERKYEAPFSYTPRAKFIWAVNELPKIMNAENNGLSRRLLIIKFPPLAEELRNVDLKSAIMNERAGILNYALDGLDQLNARGKFSIPPSVVLANNQYIQFNDHLAKFIAEKCNKNATHQIKSSKLYEAYSNWCNENGITSKSIVSVSEDLTRLDYSKHATNGCKYWSGLSLK